MRRWPLRVATGAGLACLVAGGALLFTGPGPADFGAAPAASARPAPAVPTDGTPSAVPPVVVGTVPVELALPGRGVLAPVVPVGTAPGGSMVIPDPPSTVGWWAPGPLAGSATGVAVLAGHVDTAADGLGVLAVLREVGPGEEVVVRGADGRELRYVVAARREYRKADLPLDLFTGDGPPGLVLITCGGAFDPATGHYQDNVVVHAVPV
ncbi:class F sortase [Pseudonocardia abyssalis]|uniref:Class F sortase n=1 Tax=Pseudonocardia abyssalis TaxID=2792008 RepID=A0ABS6UW10_9PSEU|nr:class F sortase [Pseudonocardia abyssalis]MBW0114879.1 class F sortase [Pseudonocardia abyssalis]MBW0136367.1 class F sortase [Pseudonocardia abyssalis]